jgi:hypothetical protein
VCFHAFGKESLGKLTGVHAPVRRMIVTLASELTRIDFRSQARDLKYLGLDHLGLKELKRPVDEGA